MVAAAIMMFTLACAAFMNMGEMIILSSWSVVSFGVFAFGVYSLALAAKEEHESI